MSWGTCYSASNNIHFNLPPIMNDGRVYSSWQPSAVVNEHIKKVENIHTNWDYRKFMTNNGLQIIKANNYEACSALGLPVHFPNSSNPANNVPHVYYSSYDHAPPGYGYPTSDLKNVYLSRQELLAKMMTPSIQINPN